MSTTTNKEAIAGEWAILLAKLQLDIGDDYRASDDPCDEQPGMQVTFGFTPAGDGIDESWSYQTGDNSYSGGAYGHPYWGVINLYRDSNCTELAEEAVGEVCDRLWESGAD